MWLSDVECDKDSPHIFYCRNNGWGNRTSECDSTNALKVECKRKKIKKDIEDILRETIVTRATTNFQLEGTKILLQYP